MTIHEPATLVTDVLLAALAGGCAWRLQARRPSMGATSADDNPATRWWGRALFLTALSALVGGLYHGLAPNFPELAGAWWRLTLLLLCLVSTAMGICLVHEMAPASNRRSWRVVVLAKLALFATLVLIEPRFLVAIIDYGLVMLAWAAAALVARRAWSGWMLTAIAFSAIAAAVQQLRWGLSPQFNHNDVYHVIQALAIWAFYQAGLRLGPADAKP